MKITGSRCFSRMAPWLLLALVAGMEGCQRTPAKSANSAQKSGAGSEKDGPKLKSAAGKDDKSKAADKKDGTEEDDLEKELAKRKKAEKKPPFEVDDFRIMPYDNFDEESRKQLVIVPAKPGHWSSSVRSIKANDDNFAGKLEMYLSKGGGIEKPVPHTRYWMQYARPVTLTKGETRYPELDFFLPIDPESSVSATLSSNLSLRGSGRPVLSGEQHGLQLMQRHEQFMVVLCSNTAAHGFWRLSDLARPPKISAMVDGMDDLLSENAEALEKKVREARNKEETRRAVFYRVLTPSLSAQEPTPLPSSCLAWTTIACVVWDDVDMDRLNRFQQQALLDWLHWGGQLVISGPQSLEKLRGGFMQPYLPASPGKGITLETADFAPIAEKWGLGNTVQFVKPIGGVELLPEETRDSSPVQVMLRTPEGKPLVVERRCGRGRVVATAFRLSERALTNNWKSYDNFLNGAILRRPPREYFQTLAGDSYFPLWHTQPGRQYDGRLLSDVCMFGRDALPYSQYLSIESQMLSFGDRITQEIKGNESYYDPATANTPRFGRGEWTESSAVSDAARQALRKASGIEIPKAEFVLWVTAGYLVLLAPVNYLFFRLLGRLEWAWFAVPAMALGAAAAVVHLAQLEIGFVSSHTEIAVLELQGDYQRGLVTRYGALYTSLADDYSLRFDDPGAKALPFARDPNFAMEKLERASKITFEQRPSASTVAKNSAEMAGMRVISNDTDFFRAEHMLPLSGPLRLENLIAGVATISNATSFRIKSAAVVRTVRREQEHFVLESAWLGDLEPGAVVRATLVEEKRVPWGTLLQVEENLRTEMLFPQWRLLVDSAASASASDPKTLDLSELLRLAVFDCSQQMGALRLIGVIEGQLPGMEVFPKPAQSRGNALLVANLGYGKYEQATSDVNVPNIKKLAPLE